VGNQGKIYTRKSIAKVLTISENRVKQLTKEGKIEEFSPGYYKLLPAVQGYIGYLQSLISDDDLSSDYSQEKARLTRIKREDAELDLQVKRNELHHAHIVEFIVTNYILAFKAKMETMPFKVLPLLMAIPEGSEKSENILEVLKKSTSDALQELAAYNPEDFTEGKYNSSLDEPGEGKGE